MRSPRRTREKLAQDRLKVAELFFRGLTVSEIAKKLGLTYTQTIQDIESSHIDPIVYKLLIENQRSGRRLTLEEVTRTQNLLRVLPLRTVAAIMGVTHHRLLKFGSHKQKVQNTRLLAQVGEWLLGRYIRHVHPGQKVEVLTCLVDSPYAPDFHLSDEWWESKSSYCQLSRHIEQYETQFAEYLAIIPRGIIVYWFGCLDSVREEAKVEGLIVVTGSDVLKRDLPPELRSDIELYLKGDFIQLAKKWYGLS